MSSKMKRKLPSFPKEEDSLENRAAQSVFEQFLAKHPDQLGAILARCTPKVRSQAIKSLDDRDVVSVKVPISEMMAGKPLKLFDEITIIKTDDGETAHEADYITLRASMLDERIFEVLSLWLEDFYKKYPDADSRESWIERDGSARLDEDSSISALQDFIERYVEDLVADKYAEAEYGGKPGEEDEQGYEKDAYEDDDELDHDTEVENITDMFKDLLSDAAGPAGFGNENKFRLYRPNPKITIRYEAQ